MFTFTEILTVIAPIFILIAIGAILRKKNLFTHNTEEQLFRVAINIFYPCLVFESILGRESLRDPKILIIAPLLGISTILIGYPLAWGIAKLFRMSNPQRRSFCYAAATGNTGYIGIPIVMGLFDKEFLGVYLYFCVWTDALFWAMASSVSEQFQGIEWRKVFNIPFLSIVVAVIINFFHLTHWVPSMISKTISWISACYIPLALILLGSLGMDLMMQRHSRPKTSDICAAYLDRTILFPLIFIAFAYFLPVPSQLKAAMMIYAAVPAALSSFIMVKYYKGIVQTAFAVSLSTTTIGLITIPLWLKFGLSILSLKP